MTTGLHPRVMFVAATLLLACSMDVRGDDLGLKVENGWFVQDGQVIWGYCQHNGWWRAGQRANITRNAPGDVRPNRTEDLDKLTDSLVRFGCPGFEHNFGLWYDRRRDRHDVARRPDEHVVPPYLEQPWARSNVGRAWDGLSKYDLSTFNEWYFERLKKFADLCDQKGLVFLHNSYMQHALLETDAHYVDFPWRPTNCIQATDLPDSTPAADAFYDTSHALRRSLHQAYIRKCLDALGENSNVVFLCSEEYTGPLSFMLFWLDTVFEWEQETGRDVHIAISGTKDVVDAVLADASRAERISTVDLRYWWYQPDGKLFAPPSAKQVAGRYVLDIRKTSPEQMYRQAKEYRLKHRKPALVQGLVGTRQHAWASLMGGVSLQVGQMSYPNQQDPPDYISLEMCKEIQPTYNFIRNELSYDLPKMQPVDLVRSESDSVWCLADNGNVYLAYALHGGRFQLDLSRATGRFGARWFNPRTGAFQTEGNGFVGAGQAVTLTAPDEHDWALILKRVGSQAR